MACCPNGNECNHIITLGYLKSFIGENVKDSNGSVKHVTSSKGDDYCPTYSELTGGSLIPNFVDGGSGKWSLNVDGITVNGSYQSNQCVMQQDLVLTYTRFDSLTITATPATNIDACSGTSTMSYTYKLKKTVKSMNGSCSVGETSSTDNDTTNVIVYTSNQTWATISKPTVTISKNNPNNNGRSNARVATITGKITYKGENKTATTTITQNGLTGSYKFWYSDYTIHGKNVTCNGSSFGCNGGSYSAIAYYYQDDWDVYRWQDKCGVNYNSDTKKRNEKYNTYHEHDRYSGSFSNKAGQCGTWTDSKGWAGYGSCSWTQTCNECKDCDPFYEYRTTSAASKSVGCNGGSVSFTANVPYTYHDKHKDESGFCIDNTSEGTSAHTIYVDVESNAGNASSRTITGTKDFISYKITQSAGCTVKSVTSYTDVYAACEGGTNITGETIRTVATTGGCCATSSTTSRVSVNIGDLECNSGATRLIRDAGDYKIYQYGRADCCTEPCKCTDLVVSGDKTIESDANTNIEIGTYTAGCVTGIAASESVDWVTSISASGGSIKATVTENTSTTSARTATITVTGKAGTETCTKTFTLTQKAKATACTCDDLVVSGDKTIESNAATLVIGTYTAGCVTGIAASESVDRVTDIVAINGRIAVTVTENTSTESARTATITVTGKAGSNTCTKTFTLTQKAKATACTCDDLAVTGTTEVPYYGGEIVVATYTADSCITNIGLTANPDCITNINVDYPNKGDISGLVGKYDGSRDINVTVTGKAGTEICSKEFVLKQIKPVTTCYRGTDNGTDVRERPVLFCGTRSTTGGTIPYTERYDSILVPGGLQYYSGAAEPTETSPWHDLTSSFVNIAPWAQMRYSNNASTVCHPEYGGVHIKVTDFEYTGQSVRSVNFWFRSKNRSLTKMTSCDGAEYDLCKQWQYEIRQCAKGYYWCGTSSSNCIAVECGSSDCHMGKYSDVPCDCDSPTPTTCTYTVKSNVEGATVTWSGGTMTTTKTTTIVDGTSSISIPCAGVIRATLTKEGCTFDDSNVKVHEGVTVTINGTCSGPTPTTCTYTVKSNVEGATVTWSGGTMGTTKTTTIVGHTSSISIPCAGVIRATLTKEGCTFDDSNVKVHENEEVTINGTCSGPTPTVCTCSSSNFSVTGKTNISPGVNVVVATYTANCIDNAEVRYRSGDDFLHGLTIMNGNIAMDKLNVHQNDLIGTYAIYINGEKCTDDFMVKSPGSLVCDCNSINITQQSVSFDHNSGSTKVGTIEQGCTLNVLSTSDWASLTQNGTDIVASVKENTTSSERGVGLAYNIVGFTANTCGTVVFTQSGAPTTYNISIYGEQAGTTSGVKVSLAYTASPTLPSGAHFQFEDGCTLRIKYGNCNGSTEYPIVPNNHVVPNCTPGSGREYAIESGTRVQMETLSVNFSLFGETHHLTSGESGTYTNQGNTYIVTVQ